MSLKTSINAFVSSILFLIAMTGYAYFSSDGFHPDLVTYATIVIAIPAIILIWFLTRVIKSVKKYNPDVDSSSFKDSIKASLVSSIVVASATGIAAGLAIVSLGGDIGDMMIAFAIVTVALFVLASAISLCVAYFAFKVCERAISRKTTERLNHL